MKKAIIFHGTGGSPESNWFRWLEHELKARGSEVWLPQLPDADHPSLAAWAAYVRRFCPFVIDEETLIVGHSSGAILALTAAGQNAGPVGGVVCVSVFGDNDFLKWSALDRFFDLPFNFAVIKINALKLVFLHSDNDPYVPLEQARSIAGQCGASVTLLPGQGHFNLEMGRHFEQFPELVGILIENGLINERSQG